MFSAKRLATSVNEVVVFIYYKGTEKQNKKLEVSRNIIGCGF